MYLRTSGHRVPVGPEPRSDGLDGLRALAALSVVAFHVWLYNPTRVPGRRVDPVDQLFFELHLGLICFFVLSGFLLYRGLLRRPDVRRYAVRRIARIVPAYYVSIALCLIVYAAVGFEDLVPPADELPLFFAFAQNYSWDALMEINPVAWTLCVEAAFYLVLPLMLLIRRRGHQVGGLALLIAATVVWNHFTYGSGWADIAEKTLPAYAGHFALGMLVAIWVESRRERLGGVATAGVLAAGALAVAAAGWWYETPGLAHGVLTHVLKLPAALGFALIVAAVAGGRGVSVVWLRWRPLAFAGVVSYGIYLWHLPMILLGNHLGLLPAGIPARLLVIGVAAVGAGWLSWVLVERPAMRLAAQQSRPRRNASGVEAEPALS
jgi:peptidoglycan/LPS O-acetylase OafA/YrhL